MDMKLRPIWTELKQSAFPFPFSIKLPRTASTKEVPIQGSAPPWRIFPPHFICQGNLACARKGVGKAAAAAAAEKPRTPAKERERKFGKMYAQFLSPPFPEAGVFFSFSEPPRSIFLFHRASKRR